MFATVLLKDDPEFSRVFVPVTIDDMNRNGKLNRKVAFWSFGVINEYLALRRRLRLQGKMPVVIYRQQDYRDARETGLFIPEQPRAFPIFATYFFTYAIYDAPTGDRLLKDDPNQTLGRTLMKKISDLRTERAQDNARAIIAGRPIPYPDLQKTTGFFG